MLAIRVPRSESLMLCRMYCWVFIFFLLLWSSLLKLLPISSGRLAEMQQRNPLRLYQLAEPPEWHTYRNFQP